MERDLSPGKCENAVAARLRSWRGQRFGRRLWEKDPGLWPGAATDAITARLGWLDLPDKSRTEVAAWKTLADDLVREGIAGAVLVGMGGSSLAPEVFGSVCSTASGYPQLMVLDSTHPDAVRSVEASLSLERTAFIVSSKSGTTIETVSLFNYFFERLGKAVAEPGRRFIAITDAGTPLDVTARERGFRAILNAPSDVGGRFSSLSAFGLVPAAITGADLAGLLETARMAAAACGRDIAEDQNPGLALGALLAEAALAGRDKLTFFTSPSLAELPVWIEQLVAESTGKNGIGIVPIVGEGPIGADRYGSDRIFVRISIRGEEDPELDSLLSALAARAHPVVRIVLDSIEGLGAEMFIWEVATAAACAILGVNPFDQPDVETSKRLAREAVTGSGAGGLGRDLPAAPAATVGDTAAQRIMIAGLMDAAQPGSYVSLQAYLPPHPETTRLLQALRLVLNRRTGLPATLGYGPRFLHSTGQLHKGGPNTGIFIQIVDKPVDDLAVPSAAYTFAGLIRAQALGDLAALSQLGRRVARVEIGGGPAARRADIEQLAEALEAS